MRSIFSIKKTGILTLKDLQRVFSPWDIYNSLSDFLSFVSIHSKPLPVKICYKEDGELVYTDADCFDKSFWIDILNNNSCAQENDAVGIIKKFSEEKLSRNSEVVRGVAYNGVKIGAETTAFFAGESDKDAYKKKTEDNLLKQDETKIWDKEYGILQIEEKLQHIIKTAKLSTSAEDALTAVRLLAICELSEINALDFSFSKPAISNISKNIIVKKENNETEKVIIKSKNKEKDQIAKFPSTDDISLVASDIPYKYWYHSSNELENGETIKTVCVYAKASINTYSAVIIELYDEATGKCIHKLKIAGNEYRYCNVAGGKIIKFLPTISMSADAYLYRKDFTKSDITVCKEGEPEWTLCKKNVSSFGIAGKNEGFILIENGKLNPIFYKKNSDYMTSTIMSMIMDPVVEIKLTEAGYIVLTSNGYTFSNISSFKTAQNVISLDEYSRVPMPKSNLCKADEMTEVSVGCNKDCLMIRSKVEKKSIVLFKSQGKHIHIDTNSKGEMELTVK